MGGVGVFAAGPGRVGKEWGKKATRMEGGKGRVGGVGKEGMMRGQRVDWEGEEGGAWQIRGNFRVSVV